jgi:hypothetical protein
MHLPDIYQFKSSDFNVYLKECSCFTNTNMHAVLFKCSKDL